MIRRSCCRKEDPFQGQKVGSCLTLRNELSKETCLTQQEILLGRGIQAESSSVGDSGELLCHMAHGLGFYGDGINFRVVSDQSFWLRVLSGRTLITQPRWVPARILGGGWTRGVTFWPFLNSSGWRWFIIFVFLTRTPCRKTTCANSNYGGWSGWAVSVSGLPLTVLSKEFHPFSALINLLPLL